MKDLIMKPFIRGINELTEQERISVRTDGGYCENIDLENPMILESLQLTYPLGNELYITYYISHMPGVIYMNYCFENALDGILKQITKDGHFYFLSELKEKLPTFYKLLYNSMIYQKNASNSEKGILFSNENKIFFMKSFIIGMKQMEIEDVIDLCEPYVEPGLKILCEVQDTPVLDGYKAQVEMEDIKAVGRFAVRLLVRSFFGM